MVEAEALASTAIDTTTEWVELLRRHVVEEPWGLTVVSVSFPIGFELKGLAAEGHFRYALLD